VVQLLGSLKDQAAIRDRKVIVAPAVPVIETPVEQGETK